VLVALARYLMPRTFIHIKASTITAASLGYNCANFLNLWG
jgi:hypothetical protein